MLHFLLATILIIGAYLLGSISSAILVSRFFSLPDPRSEGSKNPGATNVLRLSGKKYAALVLVFDVLKGFVPVILGQLLGLNYIILGFICFAAVLGHVFPIFFNFHGGKGVATAMGGLLGLNFIMGAAVIGIWLLVLYISHYASLASIIALTFAPFLACIAVDSLHPFPPLFFVSILTLYKHKDNITRLMDGEESKTKFSKNIADAIFRSQKKEE